MELSRDRMNDKKEVFMRKKHVAYFSLLIIVALLFSGCDAMITNVYKTMNLGQPDPEILKKEDVSTLIEQSGISSGTVSDSFIEAVISDEATKDAIIAKLEEVVDSGEPEDAQAAQALIIEIEIADLGADELIDSFNEALPNLASLEGSGNGPAVGDIIDLLIPQNLQDNPEQLSDLIDDLVASDLDEQIATLANLIGTDEEGKADLVFEGLDYGTMAQTAALILIVQNIEPVDESQSAGEAVVAALEALQGDGDPAAFISLDSDTLTNNPDLAVLFDAAGAGELYDSLMESLSSSEPT